ncbi:hypothetical protein [Phyllobacterium sp. YR531]|uniref:hypothetical protein n=1 Tax=Phyllobacterium sp. YR531 TaxID=1144343 RepID=UPI00026F8F77|nr:hypothetical protein [Phyllobacterium sp. YR531]EJN06064.1 hypothetical protein PMI41_00459 [Phyllobacterium sp. YR531]
MAFVVKFDGKSFSLKSADGAQTYNVNPAQQQSWQVALEKQAKQQGFKDTSEMLSKVTVTVPNAGDSQYKIADQFGIGVEGAQVMVEGNVQFADPDLIHTYNEGDLKPDFVTVPVAPEPILGSDAPAGKPETKGAPVEGSEAPAGQTDSVKKQNAIDTLKNPSATAEQRKTAISTYLDGHNGSVEERTKAAIDLLDPNQDYGEQKVRTAKRQEILDVLVEPYKDNDTKKKVFDSLLEHTWVSEKFSDQSMDKVIGEHAKNKYDIDCDPTKWNK